MVVHACNSNYAGGKGRRISDPGWTWAKKKDITRSYPKYN
jgi:hypothetical protein